MTNSELRQKRLFNDYHILKSVLIVSIPAMIMGLMAGLYAFGDQLMMIKLIPGFLSPSNIFKGLDYNRFLVLQKANQNAITYYDTSSIIRTAVAFSAPITVFINAAALLMGNGTAVKYSQNIGRKDRVSAEKSWTLGFYSNLMFSLLVTVLCCGLAIALVNIEQGNSLQVAIDKIPVGLGDGDKTLIQDVYTVATQQIRTFTLNYIYVLGACSIFAIYTQFFSLLIIAEGKQVFVVTLAIICNGLNLFLDWVFIKYAHLAMIGGAIATDIGWLLNTASYIWYISYLEKRNQSNLRLSALKRINYSLPNFWGIFSLGLPSFLRNLSMAIAATIQIALLVTVVNHVGSGVNADQFQNIYGAVNPIYNLFYTAEFGIINGARVVCSYNYGARNYKRVRSSQWIVNAMSLIYGLIIFGLVGYALADPILGLFNITNNLPINEFNNAHLILRVAILQMPMIAIGIGGMMMFQSTGRWWQASICGLMQGVICCIPISFIIQAIAISVHSITLFLWCPFIVLATSALIMLIWSLVYARMYLSPDVKGRKLRHKYDQYASKMEMK